MCNNDLIKIGINIDELVFPGLLQHNMHAGTSMNFFVKKKHRSIMADL